MDFGSLQVALRPRQPFARALDGKGLLAPAAWKGMDLPSQAQDAFIAAERAGIRDDILTAAAQKFKNVHEAARP